MREILFRGKKTYDQEWIEGYYCRYETTQIGGGVNEMHRIVPYFASALYGFEVDPSTIGQYTGLTDKNGKKIFEGDIVKHLSDNMVYLIEYDNRFGMYVSKQKGSSYSGCIRCEIIGNIHDNPELLKER